MQALIHHNIFTDSLAVKSYRDTLDHPNNISLLIVDGDTDAVVLKNNLFFLRYFGPRERHLVGDAGYGELENVLLFGTVFGDPLFQGVVDLLAAGGARHAMTTSCHLSLPTACGRWTGPSISGPGSPRTPPSSTRVSGWTRESSTPPPVCPTEAPWPSRTRKTPWEEMEQMGAKEQMSLPH